MVGHANHSTVTEQTAKVNVSEIRSKANVSEYKILRIIEVLILRGIRGKCTALNLGETGVSKRRQAT